MILNGFFVTILILFTLVLIILTFLAKIRVDLVSEADTQLGLILAMTWVLEFPPRESLRKCVSFESLKGICFFFLVDSTRELITFPRTCKDLLILHRMFNRKITNIEC